jgi:hypothetical protein
MEISGSAYRPCPAVESQEISGLTAAQMCCRLAKSVRIRFGGISRPAAVAAGPAPGRLFPQLSQQNSIVTVCQTAPAAGAPWRSDGADIARTLSAYIAWQRRAEDASGGNLTEFANRPGRRHEKAVQAAFAIVIRG